MSFPRPVPPAFAWADRLTTVGVTGTNGKTSTTHMLAAIFQRAHAPSLAVGTVGMFLGEVPLEGPRTATRFATAMESLHDAGGRYAAVECTSEGLLRGYARRWRFDHAVFTNLSDDHLEQHGSWEAYLAAKAQLFVHLGPGRTAVLNAADPAALALDAAIPPDVLRRWYAVPQRGAAARPPDLALAGVDLDVRGTSLQLVPSALAEALGGSLRIRLVGHVFAENALAAALGAHAAGIDPPTIAAGLGACTVVPGRFEVVSEDPLVVVDYAHTPDALGRTLASARALARRHVLLVMGAGGNRSQGKRPAMGEVAGMGADRVWVTNDNPRREDPTAITTMITRGLERCTDVAWVVEQDRGRAIEAALAELRPGDVLVVAGKGHETTQEVGDAVLPWSDQAVVRRLLASGSR